MRSGLCQAPRDLYGYDHDLGYIFGDDKPQDAIDATTHFFFSFIGLHMNKQ